MELLLKMWKTKLFSHYNILSCTAMINLYNCSGETLAMYKNWKHNMIWNIYILSKIWKSYHNFIKEDLTIQEKRSNALKLYNFTILRRMKLNYLLLLFLRNLSLAESQFHVHVTEWVSFTKLFLTPREWPF